MDIDASPAGDVMGVNPDVDSMDGRDHRGSSPALPSLPTVPVHSQLQAPQRPSLMRLYSSRKRPFRINLTRTTSAEDQAELAAAFNTSSDPAFFSSDETPDLENYSQESGRRRKKKVYSGTWWGGRLRSSSGTQKDARSIESVNGDANETVRNAERHLTPGQKRRKQDRKLRRNFDSGIYMADEMDPGSSETSSGIELSSDGVMEEDAFPSKYRARSIPGMGHNAPVAVQNNESWGRQGHSATPHVRTIKKLALHDIVSKKPSLSDENITAIVYRCLENSDPDVDLTNMGIESLPPSFVDLRTLVNAKHPSHELFAPLSCRLRIYLANNQLSFFPGQLLKVTNIELLSLRQNQLTQLPDALTELKHLRELNISSNKLEYLPFNILTLCNARLQKIHSEPNPWRALPPQAAWLSDFPRLAINQPTRSIRRIAVEQASEKEPNGSIKRQTVSYRHRLGMSGATVEPQRSPSLSEVVLRRLTKVHTACTDLSVIPDTEFCPDGVKLMLHALYRVQVEGRRSCTFCDRDLIVPRYEWLEWWSIVDFNTAKGDFNPVAAEYEVRDQCVTPQNRQAEVGDTTDGLMERDTSSERTDEPRHDQSGQVLPFHRASCGCRTQLEGLELEKGLWKSLAELPEDIIKEKERETVGDGAHHGSRREWPTLWKG